MRIKILLAITMMGLAISSAQAQVSLSNANTVEALIGAYPDMPSAGTLGAVFVPSKSVVAQESVQAFHDKLDKIRDRYKVIKETSDEQSRVNFIEGLDKKMRNDYGKSVDELQNMSVSERESWAIGLADKQLKKLGINKSAKQISAHGEMSEAEAQQVANQITQSMSGMSMAEIQALASKLENMSEEEQIAYMQNNGVADRMMKNAGKVSQTSNASSNNVASIMKIQEEISAIQKQWNFIDGIHEKEKQEIIEKIRQIIVKYDAQMPAESGKIRDKYFGEVLLTYHTKAEQEQVEKITLQCFTECFTLWRNFVSKRQGILKTRLTDCTRFDELHAQMMELQGFGNQVAVPSAYSVADEYWNITRSVTQLPDDAMPEYEN